MICASENGRRRGDRFDGVLFDASGTLIRPSAPVGDTYALTARRYGMVLEAEKLAQAFGEVLAEMPVLSFNCSTEDELRRLECDWWRTLVRRVVSSSGSGIRDFDAFFGDLYAYYAQGHAWKCFPEVPRVLEVLRAKGYKLGVVSNFDSRLPGILRALGIHDRFGAIVYSSAAGSAKPEPEIFRRALAALGVAPARAIHVGDSFEADVKGAIAAGISGLLIRRDKGHSGPSDRTISSLDELLDESRRLSVSDGRGGVVPPRGGSRELA